MTTTTTKPATMRAWRYSTAPIEKHLKLLSDVPKPTVTPTGILVKVHSMSLNPIDYKLPDMGLLSRAVVGSPATPGLDFSGSVVEIGKDVPAAVGGGYSVGQEVYGRLDPCNHGSLGEYVLASYEGCVPLPSREEGGKVTLEEASCAGTAALSAWQSIAPYVKEGKGDKVFIIGGSGGVGTLGIQMAKALGCHVSVSCSARNEELCRNLGADEVVDYNKTNVVQWLREQGKVFQVVVDAGPHQAGAYGVANDCLVVDGGKFVCVGGGADVGTMKLVAKKMLGLAGKVVFFAVKNNHEDLRSIGKLIQEGKLKIVHEVFPFDQAIEAVKKLRGNSPSGKIVVRVGS